MTARTPWFALGFILGIISQDEGAAQIAYDLGVATRVFIGLPAKDTTP